MMTPETNIPASARISIAERLIPSLSFALVAISGTIGGLMILKSLNDMRQEQNVGYAVFFTEMAKIEGAMGTVLAFAVGLGAVGIVVAIVRMFTTNTRSSPSGLLFLPLGLLSLVPPFAIHYVLHLMEGAVASPGRGGVSSVVDTVNTVSYIAIAAPALIIILLLVFSFVPLSSRLGRKFSPAVVLVLIEILTVALCAIFFWQAMHSLEHAQRMG